MAPSPLYILREETQLLNDLNKQPLSGIEVVKHPESAPPFLCNQAQLDVWIPVWNSDGSLSELRRDRYTHQVRGYVNPNKKDQHNGKVFGWDHLFVNAKTGRTYQETIATPWGKNSARQLVLGDFVTSRLFYPSPQTLKHHRELCPARAVEFSREMAVGVFMENNLYLSNPHLSVWGLDAMRAHILNEGTFFSAATSRPIKNYFSPPFGGIPLTAKKTDVEETVFMMHDLNHHNIPDLIFDGDGSIEMHNVYAAWRMMSEAMTLVIADMLYADTLVRTNALNASKVDSRIYPLFKALSIEEPTPENRLEIIRQLLWANTQYAVLGDDAEWKRLLQPGQEEKLKAYKNHFEKFFVGDHVWTDRNFKNMSSSCEFYKNWIATVGSDQFARARLLRLSEVAEQIKARGADLSSLNEVVFHVFEKIFEMRIRPAYLNSETVDEEERLSRAFHRYMIGQMTFYIHYQDVPGIPERMAKMAERLRTTVSFGEAERKEIYNQYVDAVRVVWGCEVMTTAAADNYMQKHPIFPPVYINYSRQESQSVKEVLDVLYGPPSWTNTDTLLINTSNKGKLEEYKEYFASQPLISQSEDLAEPAADPLTVIQYKASQFDRVLVDDVALDIEGMDVGIMIRHFLDQTDLGALAGKKCTYTCRVAMKVGDFVRVYEGSVAGTLVQPRGDCFGFGRYFLPDGATQTLGENMNPQWNARYLAIQKLKTDQRAATLPVLKTWNGPFQPQD